MKKIIIAASAIFISMSIQAQITTTPPATLNSASPSNLNNPASSQAVPNSTATEGSAVTPKPLVPVPTTPITSIAPGRYSEAVPTQPNLIYPASPPATTQPTQREPLTPIESTNNLAPTRPPREAASRNNIVTATQP